MRRFALACALLPGALCATQAPSNAGVFISVNFGPPALPVYVQPPVPYPRYVWTPGYWAYAPGGYYWVPGAWAAPPSVGLLWTPPYWGYGGGYYAFHPGYWGHTVGFYGGVNYGFGYTGFGYGGGYWHGGEFLYNRAVTNVDVNVVHNTYINNSYNVSQTNYTHTSYNGGPGGVRAQATTAELQAGREQHFDATANQQQQFQAAQQNHSQYATANGGRPGTTAFASDRSGFGYRNEVNTRQGNQQSRIASGTQDGQITPGEERSLENRDDSIHNEAQTDRSANGGYLTGAERQQINDRQNNVSQSIYNDKHNANDDDTAGLRNGRTTGQEYHRANRLHNQLRPRGPHAKNP